MYFIFAQQDLQVDSLIDINSVVNELLTMLGGIIANIWPIGLAVLGVILFREYMQGFLERRQIAEQRQRFIEKQVEGMELRAEAKRLYKERVEQRLTMIGRDKEDFDRSSSRGDSVDDENDLYRLTPMCDGISNNVERHIIWEESVSEVRRVFVPSDSFHHVFVPYAADFDFESYRDVMRTPPRRQDRLYSGMESDNGGGY